MRDDADPFPADVLKSWIASGAAQRWINERKGTWNHDDWVQLLHLLQRRGPVEPGELGQALERLRLQPGNAERWAASGEPARWVAERLGTWTHADWEVLLEKLRRSEHWPMPLAQIGETLERARRRWLNLQRWLDSGQARAWVELHHGEWNHDDWLALVRQVQHFTAGEIDVELLGRALEAEKDRYWNLRRWLRSGGPRKWVEARQGMWHHGDWLALLADLRRVFGPMDETAVGLALEDARRRYHNLQRWLHGGEARLWVEIHQGAWNHADWLGLLDRLEHSGWCPVDPAGLGDLLEKLKAEYLELRRWQEARERRLRLVPQPAGQALYLHRPDAWPARADVPGRALAA